ncbi:hypothetical protein [Natrinema limicola]|uniref:Uncharacterized protein n=1 Tax=Natrinema limicola JCM 13563 TaxID=1230457 RepID=M0CHZ3_9EURY|nr:hypothetical protein [Natrinema limicola]ELZ21977.1 hypothetical protein C476_06082 [Natrinema limicola JCM 13563]
MALTNSEQDSGDIVKYEVTVTGSTGIDCLVFQRDAYDSYADGARDVSVMSEYSRLDVSETEVTEQIDKGEYMFVVDHTDLLTEPSTVPVEVSFVVQMIEPP